MYSIPAALVWETLTRGRWILLGGFLGGNFVAFLVPLVVLARHGVLPREDNAMVIMHLVLTQINMMCFGAALVTAQGKPSRLFTWPISTQALVAYQFAIAAVLMIVELAVSFGLLNLAFDLGWPVWGPALFAGVALVTLYACFWLTETAVWLVLVMGAVFTLLALWNKGRYGPYFSQPTHYWGDVTLAEVGTLAVALVAAYLVGVAAVARSRSGEPKLSTGLLEWLYRLLDPAPRLERPFRSAEAAQRWFEARHKAAAMPALVLMCLVLGGGWWLLVDRDPNELFKAVFAGGAILVGASFFGGMILGNVGPSDSDAAMGAFLGSRPMTSSTLARILLVVALRSVLSAWAIWAAALIGLMLLLGAPLPGPWRWLAVPASLLGCWLGVGLGMTVLLTGRLVQFVKAGSALVVLWILAVFLAGLLGSGRAALLLEGTQFALGLAALAGTLWAFAAALRAGMLNAATAAGAAALWAALSSAAWVGTGPELLHPTASNAALVLGLAALIVAPLATAPLALAWNRVR